MEERFRVLCVCVGNVCRSPAAERLLRLRLAEAGVERFFDVTSSGTRAMIGRAMTIETRAEVLQRGGHPEGFKARRLSWGQVAETDLVLAATADVRRAVLEEAPETLRRAFTWKEFAALVEGRPADSPRALVADGAARRSEVAGMDLDTEDPIGKSAEVYARVAAEIDDAVTTIARALGSCAAQ